jgi:hypothetical protein
MMASGRKRVVMRFDNGLDRAACIAGLAMFFAVLALNLTVPVAVIGVMGLVDRILMRLWLGLEAGIVEPGETAA